MLANPPFIPLLVKPELHGEIVKLARKHVWVWCAVTTVPHPQNHSSTLFTGFLRALPAQSHRTWQHLICSHRTSWSSEESPWSILLKSWVPERRYFVKMIVFWVLVLLSGRKQIWKEGRLLPDYTTPSIQKTVTLILAAVKNSNITVLRGIPQSVHDRLLPRYFHFITRTSSCPLRLTVYYLNHSIFRKNGITRFSRRIAVSASITDSQTNKDSTPLIPNPPKDKLLSQFIYLQSSQCFLHIGMS